MAQARDAVGFYHGAVPSQDLVNWLGGLGVYFQDAGNFLGRVDQALVGASIGALGAIFGGFLGAWFVGRRDDSRRLAEHKAAVRAVLQELAGNLDTLRRIDEEANPRRLGAVTSAYSSLLVPLFSYRMPERVASHLGKAYGQLMLVDRVEGGRGVFLDGADDYLTAQQELLAYAKKTLRLKF